MLELFSTSTVFAFRRCDCGIWRWIGWPDCSSISFSPSTESELHKDPALSTNLLLLLFNGKPLVDRIHLRPVMARYGLAKVLRGVKAPQTRKKSANGFRKTKVCSFMLLPVWHFLVSSVVSSVESSRNLLCRFVGKFDRWVYAGNLCIILKLVYFDSWGWQSFVSTCDVFNCLFYWMHKMKYSCYEESSVYGWFVYWVFGWEMRRFRMASFSFFTLLDE